MSHFIEICNIDDILPNTGRAALVAGKQVAIFKVCTSDGEHIYAIDNFCPFSKANVLSRGIVGSLDDKIVVASPIYKQHFVLESGVCLEDDTVSVNSWPVSIEGNRILIEDRSQAAA